MQELLLKMSRIDDGHTESLEKHRTSLEELTHQVSPTIKDLRNTQEETNALLNALLQVVPQLSPKDSLLPPISEKDCTANLRSRNGGDETQRTTIVKRSDPESMERGHDMSPIEVPMSTISAGEKRCWSDCACECHRRQNVKTPTILNSIAGNLLLGYNGSMVFQQRCTVSTCRKRSDKSPQISYYFPKWFVQRAITLSMTTTAFGTPSLNLKVRRVVSEMSELFRLSRFGDVEGLKALFSAQKASPDDVNPIGGWTALHVSNS